MTPSNTFPPTIWDFGPKPIDGDFFGPGSDPFDVALAPGTYYVGAFLDVNHNGDYDPAGAAPAAEWRVPPRDEARVARAEQWRRLKKVFERAFGPGR